MGPDKEMDRVCGMEIDRKNSHVMSVYQGKLYYFCSEGCKAKFDRDPEYYMKEVEG